VLSLTQLEEQEYLGGAAIVARHAAALGARSFLISAMPDQPPAGRVREQLEAEGVAACFLPRRSPLIAKTRFLVEENKVLVLEQGVREPLDSHAERQAAAILIERRRDLDALIICDYGYGMVTEGLLERVLPAVRAHVPMIAGDVNGSRGSLLHFRQVDLLCPSERELRDTLHDYEGGLSSVAYRLMGQTQARHLLCTLGRRGSVVFQRPAQDPGDARWGERLLSEHFPALGGAGVDRLGCGDALLCAATMALAGGANLMQAGYLGAAAAAVEAEQVGNLPIALDMLQSWLAVRPELTGLDAAEHDPQVEPLIAGSTPMTTAALPLLTLTG
jgi:bifunctional ADP-heptose synthase (sugar kinase/adenylyltransferase)